MTKSISLRTTQSFRLGFGVGRPSSAAPSPMYLVIKFMKSSNAHSKAAKVLMELENVV